MGRSLYAGDPYCDVTLDEFRIYDGALTAYEIEATQSLGPDQLLQTNRAPISINIAGSNIVIKWPVAYARTMLLESCPNLKEGAWQEHRLQDPVLTDGSWQLDMPLSASNEFLG